MCGKLKYDWSQIGASLLALSKYISINYTILLAFKFNMTDIVYLDVYMKMGY